MPTSPIKLIIIIRDESPLLSNGKPLGISYSTKLPVKYKLLNDAKRNSIKTAVGLTLSQSLHLLLAAIQVNER